MMTEKQKKKAAMMGSEPIGKMLWKLSLPTIIGMVVQASYNLVDAAFIGKGVGTLALGGTAICFPFQLLMGALGGAIGVGGASLISRSLGRHDVKNANQALGNMVSMALILGTVLTLTGLAFQKQIVMLMGSGVGSFPYAMDYIHIILFGSVLTLLTMSTNFAVRAEGNATIAMLSMIISAFTNVFLDWLFIFPMGMGVKGAALATVLSKAIVITWLLWHFTGSGHRVLGLTIKAMRLKLATVKEILAIGVSGFVRMAGTSIVMAAVNHSMRIYGSEYYVAAYGVINRVMSLVYMALNGIALGMQPLAGFNYGAGNYERVIQAIKLAMIWATGLCVAFFVLFITFPSQLFKLFTSDPDLIAAGIHSLPIIIAATSLTGIQSIGATVFQTLGRAKPAFWLSLTRQTLLFLPLLIIMPRFLGLMGVFLAFPIADTLAALVTLYPLHKEMGKLRAASEVNHS